MPRTRPDELKKCMICGKEKKRESFYSSLSPLFSSDKHVPVCKVCVTSSCVDKETGRLNEIELNKILQMIDKPYYENVLDEARQEFSRDHPYISEENVDLYGEKILGYYMGKISRKALRNATYEDSVAAEFFFDGKIPVSKSKAPTVSANSGAPTGKAEASPSEGFALDDGFEVTKDIVELFGEGYTLTEYRQMYKKYEKLKLNYALQTSIHQEALATYVRFKVKEEAATSRGDVTEAKKWYEAAEDAAEKGKLTARQLTKADLDSGVNSVSEIVRAVEQATDVIKILPRFRYRPNDAPDFNIWCYINYERNLNDQPPVPYEDVYKFYDRLREEYLEQNGDPYGLFEQDETAKNRETVKTFISLPSDYEDLVGEANE